MRTGFKIMLIITSAVVIGTLLGMIVLSVFNNMDYNKQSARQERSQEVGESSIVTEQVAQQVETPALFIPPVNLEGGLLRFPEKSYYVVQAGAFSEQAMAEETLASIQQKGWSGLIQGQEPYRVFVGLASDKEHAMLLGQFYREQKLEIYVKEQGFPAVSKQVQTQSTESLQQLNVFLQTGDQLFGKLSSLSTARLLNPAQPLTVEDFQQVQNLHHQLLQIAPSLAEQGSIGQQSLEEMLHALTEAVQSLETYKAKSHPSYLWRVQQNLLHYMAEYSKWVQ